MRNSAVLRVSMNASMLLLGTVLRMAFAFAFVIYAARYLGVEGYGKYALTQLLFELALSLTATGLGILVTREVAKNVLWLRRHLAPAVVLCVFLSGCAAAVLAIVVQFAGYAADTKTAIVVSTAALLPATLSALAEAIIVAYERSEWVALGVAVEGIVRTLLCFLALVMGYGIVSLFVVLIITRWTQLGIYALLLSRRLPSVRWRVRKAAVLQLVKKWRVFAAETWVATLYLSLDFVLLSLFAGEAAVGLYDAAWRLIRFGPVVAQSFTTAVFPFISRLYVRSQDVFHQVSQQSIKFILVGILPVVLGIGVFSEQIIAVLFESEFAESASILRILGWLLIPQFLNPFLSRVLYARGDQVRCFAVGVVGLVTFLSLAFFLIPWFGVRGAAWTAVVSQYAALACYFVYCTAGVDRRQTLVNLFRQIAATAGLCLALWLLQPATLVTMLIAFAVLYAVLLVSLRIVTSQDFKLLQELH
jgi:O-antigen/teichoic acid export membrane protein